MNRFVKAFEQSCPGQSVNYTPNGSGAGISEFIGNQTDFGGSDSPLNVGEEAQASQRCGSPAWDLPMVFGPIAVAYNVQRLDFAEPQRSGYGPDLQRPDHHVERCRDPAAELGHRSCPTSRFGSCSVAMSPGPRTISRSISIPLPPARGVSPPERSSTAVSARAPVATTAPPRPSKAPKGRSPISNGPSPRRNIWTRPRSSRQRVRSRWRSAQSRWERRFLLPGSWRKGNDLALDTISFYRPNQPGSYPIVLATYEIVCSKYHDPQVGAAVKAFLQSAIGAGQNDLTDHGYMPIPDAFKSRLVTAINAIS